MKIAEFIREHIFFPRLKVAGAFVVYDLAKRFRDVCMAMQSEHVRVVDVGSGSIECRRDALLALRQMTQPGNKLEGVLVYIPAAKPVTDEQRQKDPFSIYGQCGAAFPNDDGDDYLNICLKAKPDFSTDIRRLFAGTPEGPSFAAIDAVGGGMNWPQLRSCLKVDSGREILLALLEPSDAQAAALRSDEGWVAEVKDFLSATLGMSLKTRGKTWAAISEEIWRFVLFSEFVFDLPEDLPEALRNVPRASVDAQPVVEGVCEALRSSNKSRARYIEKAEEIEGVLRLPEVCSSISDLGERDTFPFEERTFLRAAIRGVIESDLDLTRTLLSRRKNSVWLGKGENRAQWDLVRASLELVSTCGDLDRELLARARTQESLIDFYISRLRDVDRLQREFEQAASDAVGPQDDMTALIDFARAGYRKLSEKVQALFMRHLETSGWPPQGRLANTAVFDQFVTEQLRDAGRKIAYLMVDALRYELGVELERQLAEDGPVKLHAAYAQLPTITLVGMASLLPDAAAKFSLALENENLVPKIGDLPIGNVPQRMDYLRNKYGDRFHEMTLGDFLKTNAPVRAAVDLLVLRSTEIDSMLENNPEDTLGLIPKTLRQIRSALNKLRGMGFGEAVIVTDHGFFLNAHAEAGDVCSKPAGDWKICAHDRVLMGEGGADTNNLVMDAGKLGIRGSFGKIAMPRSMAPYRAGHLYFHGGASLTEAVVPVLVAQLKPIAPATGPRFKVELTYRNGAKRITTRIPVVDVTLVYDDLFVQGVNLEVVVEAQDALGRVVGEARPGPDVNPATRTVVLHTAQPRSIALKMDPEFEGKFKIMVLNPATLSAYVTLSLETDYTV
jgi:hypothetical protein